MPKVSMRLALNAQGRCRKYVNRLVADFLSCSGANIAIMFALMAPLFVGGLGMGAETALWYVDQRNMQNASDAAAVAAATDGTAANYANVAAAVAAQYGFTNGQNGQTVTASNAASCPSGGNTCYSVTITMPQQLYLLPVVGFSGNTTYQGLPAQTIQGSATASANPIIHQYCLLTLSTISTSLDTNGAPKANLSGCDVMADGDATCNGHNLGAPFGDAAGVNNGCGIVQDSHVPLVQDPYAYLAANIPANAINTCNGSFPQEDKHGNGGTSLSGSITGNIVLCGDQKMTGNVTINAPAGATIIIENGQLDTNGYTIQTADGSSATLVFSGTNGSYTHAPTGGGTIDIQAPTSGPWSGVAMYQDPSLTSGVDISAAGNSPTWNISGLIYLPKSNVTLSGAVDKSGYGANCTVMVTYSLQINGTGDILRYGGCPQAGLTMPSDQVGGRGQLVN